MEVVDSMSTDVGTVTEGEPEEGIPAWVYATGGGMVLAIIALALKRKSLRLAEGNDVG